MDRKCRDPHPLPPALAAALGEIADRLADAGVSWLLAGSAMRALRGFDVIPADLDLEVAGPEAGGAAEALGLTAPQTDSDARVTSLRTTGRLAGADVDLSADLTCHGPGGTLTADFAAQRRRADTAPVDGRVVPLAPLEEAIARAEVLDPVGGRARLLRGAPPDLAPDEDWIRRRRS